MGKPHAVNQRERRFATKSKIKNQISKLLCRHGRLRNFTFLILNFDFAAKRRGVPGEVKHLSTRRKIKQSANWRTIPLVAASETGGAQTGRVSLYSI